MYISEMAVRPCIYEGHYERRTNPQYGYLRPSNPATGGECAVIKYVVEVTLFAYRHRVVCSVVSSRMQIESEWSGNRKRPDTFEQRWRIPGNVQRGCDARTGGTYIQ